MSRAPRGPSSGRASSASTAAATADETSEIRIPATRIEPVTHANAAFNHPEDRWPAPGLQVLEPGQSIALQARFEVERTAPHAGAGA